MLLIQPLLIILLILVVIGLIDKLRKKQIGFLSFLIWLVFWIAVAVIIIWPETTSTLARILGVGRGADVIVYIGLIVIFYFIFYFTLKLRTISQQITKIVRKISLEEDNDKNGN